MFLQISTTHRSATDLGYLLHKNPERLHEVQLAFGKARVFACYGPDERPINPFWSCSRFGRSDRPPLRVNWLSDESKKSGDCPMDPAVAAEIIVRLTALEYVVMQIGKVAFVSAEMRAENVAAFRHTQRSILQKGTVPGMPPEVSDYLSGEIENDVDRILAGIEALVGQVWDAANTEPPANR